MQTQQSVSPVVRFRLPNRCLSCGKKSDWAVGGFTICAKCIVADNRARMAASRPSPSAPVNTACGYPVRIYATDGAGEFSTQGAYCTPMGWVSSSWNALGLNQTGIARLSLLLG